MSYRAILVRLSRNTLSMYAAFFVRKAAVLVLGVAIANWSGAGAFGLYCLALTLVEFGLRLVVFGTDILVVREISAAAPECEQTVRNTLAWRAIAAVAMYPLLVAGAGLLTSDTAFRVAIALMGTALFTDTMGDLYLGVVQGRERVDLCALAEGLVSLVGLGFGLAALAAGWGLQGLAAAYALRGVANLVLGMLVYRRIHVDGIIAWGWQPGAIIALLKKAAPIGVNRLLTIIYLGSGMVMLQYFHSEESVGRYAGSMKIFDACTAMGMLTMVAAFPTIARLRVSAPDDLRRTAADLLRFFGWLGIPLSITVALASDLILRSVFGPDFAHYGLALVLLMAAVPFSLFYGLIERLAYAAHDQHRVLWVRFVSTAVNILVIMLCIGRIEYLAPAVAILVAEIAMVAMFLRRLNVYIPGMPWRAEITPPLVAAAVALVPALAARPLIRPFEGLLFLLVFAAIGVFHMVIHMRPDSAGGSRTIDSTRGDAP